MTKVKAFVQLKSGLYGWCVMIYKFDQVSTKLLHKINHLFMHRSCYTLTTEYGFGLKKILGKFCLPN